VSQITFGGLPKGNVHIAGGYIFFNEGLANSERIALLKVPVGGGTPVVLEASYPGMYLADVSSDGGKLLIIAATTGPYVPGTLKLMDSASGSMQNIDGIECDDASWTPQGKIIYSKNQDVFLADADGSHQRKLFTQNGYLFRFRFSPDGARIRFTAGQKLSPERTIWEASADGSGVHQILTELKDSGEVCCGNWTPDGRYFFFTTILNGTSRIWAQRERGSFWSHKPAAPMALTNVPPNFYVGVPSPDGKKLYTTASEPRAELVRYDSHAHQFVPFLSGISAGDVEASREAKYLVYVRYPEDTLWRSKIDGTEAEQLTGPSLRASLPHWSPDGKQIAFSGTRPGRPWNIFLISAAGGPSEQITNGAFNDLDPSWSPDGSKLAFSQERQEGSRHIVFLKVMEVATRQATDIPGTDGICCPRWSPDGRFVLASHSDYDDLLVYEFATQKMTTIVKGLGPIGYMEWSNDSKYVTFDTLAVEEPYFYHVRVSDAHLETIVSLKNFRRYYGDFGPWTGLAPDGSPLLVRDISNEEVYALDLQLP
jgi:Tol biopolymer transport system component